MGIGSGIFVTAVGAILRWGITVHTNGVNWHSIGIILMVVGLATIALSVVFWDAFGTYAPWRRTVVRRTVVPTEQVVERDVYYTDPR